MMLVFVSVLTAKNPAAVATIVVDVAYIACGDISTGMHCAALEPSGSGHTVDNAPITVGIAPCRYMQFSISGVDGSQSSSAHFAAVMNPLRSTMRSAARLSSRSGSYA